VGRIRRRPMQTTLVAELWDIDIDEQIVTLLMRAAPNVCGSEYCDEVVVKVTAAMSRY
jgi:hypothetical protein